jgi:hypothetical protein
MVKIWESGKQSKFWEWRAGKERAVSGTVTLVNTLCLPRQIGEFFNGVAVMENKLFNIVNSARLYSIVCHKGGSLHFMLQFYILNLDLNE